MIMDRTSETSRKVKQGRSSACRTEGHRENECPKSESRRFVKEQEP
jgi:hypothetical protein